MPKQELKLASFKEDQRPYRGNAASHVGAAVLVHVARSGRLDAALKLLSSKSSVKLAAAGHVCQNSSAHVARSFAAIWQLLLFK